MISYTEIAKIIVNRDKYVKKICNYIFNELSELIKLQVSIGMNEIQYQIIYNAIKIDMDKYNISKKEIENIILLELKSKGFEIFSIKNDIVFIKI